MIDTIRESGACGKIVVRVALESDVGQVWRLLKQLAVYEDRLDEFDLTIGALRRHLWGLHPVAGVFLAWCDNKAIGVAVHYRTFPTFSGRAALFVEDLFVSPLHRHRGAGARLLHACRREAVREGCGMLQWWTLDWNTEALSFYRRIDARPVGTCIVHALDVRPTQADTLMQEPTHKGGHP